MLSSSFSSNSPPARDGGRLIPAALIKLINGKADANEPGPGWMWVLAMEIMRGLVAIPSSRTVSGSITIPWQPTVAPAAPLAHVSSPPSYPPSSSWSPHVHLLRSAQMHGVGVPASDSQSHLHSHSSDSVAEMLAKAASGRG
ncbi:hypothetical protein BGY98DRAFT_1099870 [Russula aff. rugulosa BPL654]|nr:hypothetical protein BGY98DRAFT_1099870 [Russula aff. rugulosa BPL654]